MKKKPPATSLTPAERTARLLAPRGMHWNFTTTPTPSKTIHPARGAFKTI